MDNLEGRAAIVTGATGGIGREICFALAREGVRQLLVARQVDALEQLRDELLAGGAEVEFTSCDVTDPDQRRNLPRRARGAFGQIDILINNAGIEEIIRFEKQSLEMLEATILTNLMAPLLMTREALPFMLERGYGSIINVGSLAGRLGMPFAATYAASKAALNEWSLSLYAELAGTGVHVAAVIPGFVREAGMFARKGRPAPALLGTCRPQEVADAVIEAIRRQVPELIVSGRPTRPLATLKTWSPGLLLRLSQRLGIVRFLQSIAADTLARRRAKEPIA